MDFISMTVGVTDHTRKATYEDVSLWAAKLTETSSHVMVWTHGVTDESDEPETCAIEHVFYDADTMAKVQLAIEDGLKDPLQMQLGYENSELQERVGNIINRLHSAGILFRERNRD